MRSPCTRLTLSIVDPGEVTVISVVDAARTDSFTSRPCATESTYAFEVAWLLSVGVVSTATWVRVVPSVVILNSELLVSYTTLPPPLPYCTD